jgi:hypothetical protein
MSLPVDDQLLATAKHDRKAQARPSLPLSALLEGRTHGCGVRAAFGCFRELVTVFCSWAIVAGIGRCDAKINLLPITDAALHASGIVSCRANSPRAVQMDQLCCEPRIR